MMVHKRDKGYQTLRVFFCSEHPCFHDAEQQSKEKTV